jgi:ATP-dependent RNA helicase DDX24/MAK5
VGFVSINKEKVKMAPIEKKRPQKGAGQKARKRQRIALEDGIQETAGLGPRSLDALPWNEVALPARLDDAEGFFGLEEVSDVEIVRDPNIGKVEYRVGKAS